MQAGGEKRAGDAQNNMGAEEMITVAKPSAPERMPDTMHGDTAKQVSKPTIVASAKSSEIPVPDAPETSEEPAKAMDVDRNEEPQDVGSGIGHRNRGRGRGRGGRGRGTNGTRGGKGGRLADTDKGSISEVLHPKATKVQATPQVEKGKKRGHELVEDVATGGPK